MSNEPGDREQLRYYGEKTALRFFDPKDPVDLARMEKLLEDKGVINFVDGIDDMNAKDIKRWLTRYHDKRRTKNWEVCYLVSGSKGVVSNEVGEMQGFVNFYPDEESRELLPEKYRSAKKIVGVGYGRYPNSKPGQMSGVIRQACVEINKRKGDLEDQERPDMVILATIREENFASMSTAEDACFEKVGSADIKDEKTNETHKFSLYVLNWEKLNAKLHSQIDKYLLAK